MFDLAISRMTKFLQLLWLLSVTRNLAGRTTLARVNGDDSIPYGAWNPGGGLPTLAGWACATWAAGAMATPWAAGAVDTATAGAMATP